MGCRMAAEGAAIVDVGGESTRPGARPVSAELELTRVLPVIAGLAAEGIPVSVDTSKAEVAQAALAAGAVLVNDVTALRGDPEMASVVADAGADLCLMHMLGEPRTMQDAPTYATWWPRSRASWPSAPRSPSRPAFPRSASCSTPASGSARRSRTTSRCCAHCRALRGSARSAGRLPQALPGHAHRPRDRCGPRGRLGRRRALLLPRGRTPPARARRAGHGRRARRRTGAGGCGVTAPLTIEVRGLVVQAHHGVHEHERERGNASCSTSRSCRALAGLRDRSPRRHRLLRRRRTHGRRGATRPAST